MTLLDILDHFVTISDQFYVLNPCVVTLKYTLLYRILLERKTHPCSPHTSPYSLYRESSTPRRVEHFYSKYRKSKKKMSKILKKSQKQRNLWKTLTHKQTHRLTQSHVSEFLRSLGIRKFWVWVPSPESQSPKSSPSFEACTFINLIGTLSLLPDGVGEAG